jgi:hypothetical protein
MANVYSAVAQTLSRVGATVFQPALAPLKAFTTPIELLKDEPPAFTSQVALTTVASPTLTGATDFEDDSTGCTVTNVQCVPVLYAQPFSIANEDLQGGYRLEWLAALNARKLAETISDAVLSKVTTGNFGAAVVTVDAAAFAGSDFTTLLAGISSPSRSVVLDTGYWSKVSPTWCPPGFNSVYEHSRWGTAGTKIHGFVADPAAIVLRWGLPWVLKPSERVIARELVELPQVGLGCEVAIWQNLRYRSVRACYAIYLGAGVADTGALKILTTS